MSSDTFITALAKEVLESRRDAITKLSLKQGPTKNLNFDFDAHLSSTVEKVLNSIFKQLNAIFTKYENATQSSYFFLFVDYSNVTTKKDRFFKPSDPFMPAALARLQKACSVFSNEQKVLLNEMCAIFKKSPHSFNKVKAFKNITATVKNLVIDEINKNDNALNSTRPTFKK